MTSCCNNCICFRQGTHARADAQHAGSGSCIFSSSWKGLMDVPRTEAASRGVESRLVTDVALGCVESQAWLCCHEILAAGAQCSTIKQDGAEAGGETLAETSRTLAAG